MAKKQVKKQNPKSKAKPAAKPAAGKATPAKRQSRQTVASKSATGKAKKKTTSEFRDIKPDKQDPKGHPGYVYKKIGNQWYYLKITHDRTANKSKYVPLEKNPNEQDKRPAFIKKVGEVKGVKSFGKRHKWKLRTENDKKTVKEIIDNNKKRKGG